MRELLGGFVRKGSSPGRGRTLTGEPAPITCLREACTVSPINAELLEKPPRYATP